MEKNFDEWNNLKKELEKNTKSVFFKEGEIWWISIGINNGDKLCGKSKLFSRPVLIVKKFNNHLFFAIPLSSIQKDNKYYFNFEFKGQKKSAIMCQIKPVSAKRLSSKIGEIKKDLLNAIRKKSAKTLFNLS
jgi:mRNA interferase MazF